MSPSKRMQYHHGDLRTALVDIAIELIGERGLQDFTLSEASRRLGVAPSAPYAHFADRDELLAAVASHGFRLFADRLGSRLKGSMPPRLALATVAETYVRFAADRPALYELLLQLNLDKSRHADLAKAEHDVEETFRTLVRSITGDADRRAEDALAATVEAVAQGHASLLLAGRFGRGARATARAAKSAASATLAIVDADGALAGRD